jgi:hypothetical protein
MPWIWLAGVAVVLIVSYVLLKRHFLWVAKQSPAGIWKHARGSREVLLAFDGGPRQGTYKKLDREEGGVRREFGSWKGFGHDLRILVMATDQKDHPRFGVETKFVIFYPGPNRIRITGVGRDNLTFERVTPEAAEELVKAFETSPVPPQ